MRTQPLLAALCLSIAASAACSSTTCEDVEADIGALCLPDTIAPGVTSIIEVREQCGRNCTLAPGCTATFTAGSIYLDLHQQRCSDTGFIGCVLIACQSRTARCLLPALPTGDFPLIVPGGDTQILHVRNGGENSCHLPVPLDGGAQ